MNLKLPSNNKVTIAALIFTMIVLFVALFFFLLYPKMKEIPIKESELKSQEQILSVLQGKITNTNSNTFQSTVALQKKVPVKPLSQQLLLDIEKAEVVSGSFVVNMVFEDGEVTEEEAGQVAEKEEETNDQTTTSEGTSEQPAETGEQDTSMEDNQKKEAIPLPTGVKKISITLNVESPSYFEFEKFIQILESSERITVMEAIDFTAGEEIIDYEQTEKPLSYQVKLSAFYMPSLSDLIDSLPKMETPEPAKKKNPFSKFGNVSNSSKTNSGSQTTTVDSNNDSKTEAKTDTNSDEYTVQTGDHLTKIAKKFYQTDFKEGIRLIKEANNLKDDVIRPGQVLKIPVLNQ